MIALKKDELDSLEKKILEKYADDCKNYGRPAFSKGQRFLYPKFGEKQKPGVEMWPDSDKILDFADGFVNSLPSIMLKNEEIKNDILALKKNTLEKGRWYPNPRVHFNQSPDDDREPSKIADGIFDVYLKYAGFSDILDFKSFIALEISSKNDGEKAIIEVTSIPEPPSNPPVNPKILTWQALLLSVIFSFLLGITITYLIYPNVNSKAKIPLQRIDNLDPLNIAGDWRYTVIADVKDKSKKLLGLAKTSKGKDTLVEKLQRLEGHIKIHPFSIVENNYKIEGARDMEIDLENHDLLPGNTEKKLKISLVSHWLSGEIKLFFKFELEDKIAENSYGFVELNSVNENLMSGEITYIYKDKGYNSSVFIQFDHHHK